MTERERRAARKPSSDPSTNVPLNPPDVPVEQKQAQLEGRRADQEAYFDRSEVDSLGGLDPTDIYEGELEAGEDADLPTDAESLDILTELELRDGESDDVIEAIEEGLTYVPPIDPPTVPDDDDPNGDARIAAGFGLSSLDEPYDLDHHSSFLPNEDEMVARIREALRADSSTTNYASQVRVIARGAVITLRGVVDDLDDSDNLVAIASDVEGVEEVIDELRVRSLE